MSLGVIDVSIEQMDSLRRSRSLTSLQGNFLPVDKPADFSLPAFVFTPSGFLMCIPIDTKGETIAVGTNKTSEKDRTREEWAEFEKSGEAPRLAKKDYASIDTQPVRSILDNSEHEEARLRAPYEIPDIPTWHTSRVCLIGDAAHGMPPNGTGSGLAFEDAGLLTRMLSFRPPSSTADYADLFRRFEALRRPRIEPIRKEGLAKACRSQTGP